MRRPILRLAAFLALPVLLACGETEPTGPHAEVAGDYTLRTIDGYAPPRLVQPIAGPTPIESGTLTLKANGSFHALFVTRVETAGVSASVQQSWGGSYTRAGELLDLDFGNGPTATATLAAGELTVTAGGSVLLFTR